MAVRRDLGSGWVEHGSELHLWLVPKTGSPSPVAGEHLGFLVRSIFVASIRAKIELDPELAARMGSAESDLIERYRRRTARRSLSGAIGLPRGQEVYTNPDADLLAAHRAQPQDRASLRLRALPERIAEELPAALVRLRTRPPRGAFVFARPVVDSSRTARCVAISTTNFCPGQQHLCCNRTYFRWETHKPQRT